MKQLKSLELNGSVIEMFIRPDKRYQSTAKKDAVELECVPRDSFEDASADFDSLIEKLGD